MTRIILLHGSNSPLLLIVRYCFFIHKVLLRYDQTIKLINMILDLKQELRTNHTRLIIIQPDISHQADFQTLSNIIHLMITYKFSGLSQDFGDKVCLARCHPLKIRPIPFGMTSPSRSFLPVLYHLLPAILMTCLAHMCLSFCMDFMWSSIQLRLLRIVFNVYGSRDLRFVKKPKESLHDTRPSFSSKSTLHSQRSMFFSLQVTRKVLRIPWTCVVLE